MKYAGLINNQQTEDWDKKMKIENYKWETGNGNNIVQVH